MYFTNTFMVIERERNMMIFHLAMFTSLARERRPSDFSSVFQNAICHGESNFNVSFFSMIWFALSLFDQRPHDSFAAARRVGQLGVTQGLVAEELAQLAHQLKREGWVTFAVWSVISFAILQLS